MSLNFSAVFSSTPYLLEGLYVTLFNTGTSVVGGFVLGTLLTFCKLSSFIGARFLASIYTSIFRGTPLILQLSLIYYAGLAVTGYNIAVWQAGVLSFSLNSAAYVSEIMRAGVQSIDRGQFEAALLWVFPAF